MGLINYPASVGDADKVFEAALEAGAEDVSSSDDGHEIWTEQGDLHEVAEGARPRSSASPRARSSPGVRRRWSRSTKAMRGTLMKLIDTLDDDDDVQTVWGNYDVSDDIMERLS